MSYDITINLFLFIGIIMGIIFMISLIMAIIVFILSMKYKSMENKNKKLELMGSLNDENRSLIEEYL
jgi:hypothetical protein